MMDNISYTKYGIDYFCDRFDWVYFLTINDYPVLAVFFNILLLVVPYYCVIVLRRYRKTTGFKKSREKAAAIFLAFVWLMFIPNSAYIISDARHLMNYCPIDSAMRVCSQNAWMIIFFFTYAVIGWVSMVYLVNQMKKFIIEISGRKAAGYFVLVVIPLVALGLLLGLINRWNSWEIFIYPARLFSTIALYFSDFIYFRNWLVFTIFLYLLYYGGNLLFKEKIKIK